VVRAQHGVTAAKAHDHRPLQRLQEVFDRYDVRGTTSDRGHCQWIENIYYTEKHSCRISVCIKRDLTFRLTSSLRSTPRKP
jgi:hypothetical protein